MYAANPDEGSFCLQDEDLKRKTYEHGPVEETTKQIQHYENVPMQYTAIFHGYTNNLQIKTCDIFLIFALNIDSGYTLEPPQ